MTLSDLPLVNSCLNATSAILLAIGFAQIRRGNQKTHRNCMVAAFVTSTIFLACYLYYHFEMQRRFGRAHTSFTDPAWFRPFYLVLLVTHVVLAVVIVPMILRTFYLAIKGQFERHKRIARWTFPLWMYVSVTGVIIYLLLYQIFPQKRTGTASVPAARLPVTSP